MERAGGGKDVIGYHALTQAALKGVVRAVLKRAGEMGSLPGGHHFFLTFRTRTSGVAMADYLKDKFPDEMTIVIQHQYWDLEVDEEHFEIILKFGGVPQHLSVPFAAVTRFFDPSVNFGLQFDDGETAPLPGRLTPDEKKPAADADAAEGAVISLDAFRRK